MVWLAACIWVSIFPFGKSLVHPNLSLTLPDDKKICNAFNISMSEFFMEEDTTSVHLNETRFRLLRHAERLNGTQLSSMLKFLESL